MDITNESKYFLTSLVWLATQHKSPFPFSYALKAVPMGFLYLHYLDVSKNTAPEREQLFVLGACAFSAGGDIFLELDIFILGLASFLIAHVAYVLAFTLTADLDLTSHHRQGSIAFITTYATIFCAIMVPKLGALKVPVMFYLLAIISMVIGATMQPLVASSGSSWWTSVIGAYSFVLSDSTIAFDKFHTKLPQNLRNAFVMITYYVGQYFIVRGLAEN